MAYMYLRIEYMYIICTFVKLVSRKSFSSPWSSGRNGARCVNKREYQKRMERGSNLLTHFHSSPFGVRSLHGGACAVRNTAHAQYHVGLNINKGSLH